MLQRPGLAALLPIALLLLAGCSAERASQAAPLPPLRTPSAAPLASPSLPLSPSPLPPLSLSPSPLPSPIAVAVPAEASANTPQGASAFARFYFAELLRAYTTYDTRAVRSLAAESCRTCAGLTGGIDSMRQAQQRVTGPPLEVLAAEAPAFDSGPITVDVPYKVSAFNVLRADGQVEHHVQAEKPSTLVATLQRSGAKWLMSKIQVPS